MWLFWRLPHLEKRSLLEVNEHFFKFWVPIYNSSNTGAVRVIGIAPYLNKEYDKYK